MSWKFIEIDRKLSRINQWHVQGSRSTGNTTTLFYRQYSWKKKKTVFFKLFFWSIEALEVLESVSNINSMLCVHVLKIFFNSNICLLSNFSIWFLMINSGIQMNKSKCTNQIQIHVFKFSMLIGSKWKIFSFLNKLQKEKEKDVCNYKQDVLERKLSLF